ncbi:MAG: type transport system permease protein [Acidobacteriota bacterium]|jgi:ABC-2 type transport system permease protein|nr:type transport system permease protein [Acidobacteriota bacterium]
MTKFLAIVKREYLTRVRTKMFIVATVLGPVMILVFTIVPALIFNIKTGGPTRLAIVDESGKLYERVRESLLSERKDDEDDTSNGNTVADTANANPQDRMRQTGAAMKTTFAVEQVPFESSSLEEIQKKLDARVLNDQLDGYIILPANILETGEAKYFTRNLGDVITRGQIEERVTRGVKNQRMEDANIPQDLMSKINKPVKMTANKAGESGGETDSGGGFALVFIIGFLIYITIIMYGQVILAAVVEEKETRIAELLFSSVRSFPLLLGKLIGVSLVALTQFAIWALAFGAFALWGVNALAGRGLNVSVPHLPPSFFIFFFLFFLLGYFIYATFYALVGSMVTTTQEGGQVAMPILFLLITGFYLAFPVIRSPGSPLAFWVSMVPFFSPITMIVRIVSQTPPLWQIALSLGIGFATVILLMWLAARIYRIGMLMYGKRATIPEVLRWVRQA